MHLILVSFPGVSGRVGRGNILPIEVELFYSFLFTVIEVFFLFDFQRTYEDEHLLLSESIPLLLQSVPHLLLFLPIWLQLRKFVVNSRVVMSHLF